MVSHVPKETKPCFTKKIKMKILFRSAGEWPTQTIHHTFMIKIVNALTQVHINTKMGKFLCSNAY